MDWTGAAKDILSPKYYNHPTVPADSGFVAILANMKDLRVLVSEVGARSVFALQKSMKKKPLELKLESVGDSKMTTTLLATLVEACPRLRSLNVEWMGMGGGGSAFEKEAWVDGLHGCKGLRELVTVSRVFQCIVGEDKIDKLYSHTISLVNDASSKSISLTSNGYLFSVGHLFLQRAPLSRSLVHGRRPHPPGPPGRQQAQVQPVAPPKNALPEPGGLLARRNHDCKARHDGSIANSGT